ncbi:hypothetical protein MKEN_01042900 [Mycena kentingensis (nom. inval.)]|nr:hypothetical protein MKEN_01042900 [Mycena kentingensis (nom. inval.)]
MPTIGPVIPAHLLNASNDDDEGPQPALDDEDDDEDAYAPMLPPDMLGPKAPTASSSRPAAPTMPSYAHDDDSDDDIGPQPLRSGAVEKERDPVAEFIAKEEKRRKQVEEAAQPKAVKRDEWMLVPPSSSALLGTLDPAKLSKSRQFSRGTVADRTEGVSTLWTETPAERQQRLADEVAGKKRRLVNAPAQEESLELRKRARVDAELRDSVAEHTRRTRGVALVDMHSAAGKGEEKDGEPKAIWDRDRDMGLGGRLMDAEKRNKMIKEAKGLGDRFSTGKSGGYY